MARPDPIPAYEDNYIWLLRDGPATLVVDPGDAAPVIARLGKTRPTAILITHHHWDHIDGVPELHARWPDVPIFAPDDPRIPIATQRVSDGDVVEIGPWRFEVIAVPGHTQTQVAYSGEGLVFCGDSMFSLGCGRLFEGTPAQMLDSLDRLAALPGDTLLCCTHEYTAANARFALAVEPGNTALEQRAAQVASLRANNAATLPSTIDSERACNPFLRVDSPEILQSLAKHLGHPPEGRVEAFAALRSWKDGFR
ncbi:MAG: hydroxyacylglutathione hydrolase [Proteobacteria bacterium]|nr:hydroxyacylglutathione hydrolase [Pseudomonadota bacterium]